ncbi:MAG: DNA polymerase III subunit delta [Pedosphaera sp.]|nr:DNA polymerase III subunit delta [Pedosphaera sp.]
MASPAVPPAGAPLLLVCGDDDFSVKQRSRHVFDRWCKDLGGMDHEIVDAAVQNTGEALAALGRLREALDTLPFFGSSKVIWFQNCTFLGDDRTAKSNAVIESLLAISEHLKTFRWEGVRLLISAGKPDERRIFFKCLKKLGTIESFAALTADDKDWAGAAETHVLKILRAAGKEISDEALAELVTRTGPNLRGLASESEKLALYTGDRKAIMTEDVRTIVTRQKHAKAFALAESLGERNLPNLLRTLDEELWEMRVDKKRSEIGLLYGLISKVRVLLFLKELRNMDALKPARDYQAFKIQLDRLPTADLPADKKFNPLASHPFVLFQAFQQTENYTSDELISAMDALLQCNRKLVSSDLDEALVLQQTLTAIVGLKPRKSKVSSASSR